MVEYFHQLDDPYSHLWRKYWAKFAAQYDIIIKPHLINATGGRHQPRLPGSRHGRGAMRQRRPFMGCASRKIYCTCPTAFYKIKRPIIPSLSDTEFVAQIAAVSTALWDGEAFFNGKDGGDGVAARVAGSAHLQALNHYSGAMFYYAGEWYWGVDRLFYLEQRLRDLSAGGSGEYLVMRPEIDTGAVDAGAFELDFYPSLNSPYTSIIFDNTIARKNTCKIKFNHKPVLPMIMRGVAATSAKGDYISSIPSAKVRRWVPALGQLTPIGEPTRQAYSLPPLAFEQGKDEALMKSLLDAAWRDDLALHKEEFTLGSRARRHGLGGS